MMVGILLIWVGIKLRASPFYYAICGYVIYDSYILLKQIKNIIRALEKD